MDFLRKYGLSEIDINKIKNKYDKELISGILLKKNNVMLLLDYFKDNKFDIKTLLFNRLDLFLINFKHIKDRINRYNEGELLKYLRYDISLIDNLR